MGGRRSQSCSCEVVISGSVERAAGRWTAGAAGAAGCARLRGSFSSLSAFKSCSPGSRRQSHTAALCSQSDSLFPPTFFIRCALPLYLFFFFPLFLLLSLSLLLSHCLLFSLSLTVNIFTFLSFISLRVLFSLSLISLSCLLGGHLRGSVSVVSLSGCLLCDTWGCRSGPLLRFGWGNGVWRQAGGAGEGALGAH